MAAPGEKKYIIRLVYICFGIFFGLSVAAVFQFKFHNVNTSLWGLASAVPAVIALFVHVGSRKRWWDSDPRRLRVFMMVGCFIQLAGVCGFVTYLTLAITNNQGLIVYGEGYYLTCIWCFMTWKWGFLLFLFSRQYWRTYSKQYSDITEAGPNNQYGT